MLFNYTVIKKNTMKDREFEKQAREFEKSKKGVKMPTPQETGEVFNKQFDKIISNIDRLLQILKP